MKKIEKYGLVSLSEQEIKSYEGGDALWIAVSAGVSAAWSVFAAGFEEGWNENKK